MLANVGGLMVDQNTYTYYALRKIQCSFWGSSMEDLLTILGPKVRCLKPLVTWL